MKGRSRARTSGPYPETQEEQPTRQCQDHARSGKRGRFVLLYKPALLPCPRLRPRLPFHFHLLSLSQASPLGLAGPILLLTWFCWGGRIFYGRNRLPAVLDRDRHLDGLSPSGQKDTHVVVHNVVIPWAIDHKGPSLPWLVSGRLIHSHRRHDRDRVAERF